MLYVIIIFLNYCKFGFLKICNIDISKSIIVRRFKLGKLIVDDE